MTKIKILIVDDDPDFVKYMQKLLDGNQFAPSIEMAGRNVRERIADEHFDIFLVDIRMHNYSGLDVLIDIMSHSLSHKVIMVSGVAGETEAVLKCIRLGAIDYLSKPVSLPLLMERIFVTHRRTANRNIRDSLIEGIWYDLQTLDQKASLSKHEAQVKGRRLEQLFQVIFESIPGFKNVAVNLHSPGQEIDIEIENDKRDGMWRDVSGIILAECKCWSARTKAQPKDLDAFTAKLQRHATAKLGFFISWSGYTQGFERVRWANKQQGRCVVAIDRGDIEKLVEPASREETLSNLVRKGLR